jgi:hypothetical protein
VVRFHDLRAALRFAPDWLGPHAIRPSNLRHDPAQAAETRRFGSYQCPKDQGGDGFSVPLSARVQLGACEAQKHRNLTRTRQGRGDIHPRPRRYPRRRCYSIDVCCLQDGPPRLAHPRSSAQRRSRDRHSPVVESRKGAVAVHDDSVSLPRSSNRTCRFPASGFPTDFICRPTVGRRGERDVAEARRAHRTPPHR